MKTIKPAKSPILWCAQQITLQHITQHSHRSIVVVIGSLFNMQSTENTLSPTKTIYYYYYYINVWKYFNGANQYYGSIYQRVRIQQTDDKVCRGPKRVHSVIVIGITNSAMLT